MMIMMMMMMMMITVQPLRRVISTLSPTPPPSATSTSSFSSVSLKCEQGIITFGLLFIWSSSCSDDSKVAQCVSACASCIKMLFCFQYILEGKDTRISVYQCTCQAYTPCPESTTAAPSIDLPRLLVLLLGTYP